MRRSIRMLILGGPLAAALALAPAAALASDPMDEASNLGRSTAAEMERTKEASEDRANQDADQDVMEGRKPKGETKDKSDTADEAARGRDGTADEANQGAAKATHF